jgi:signal transduction histidine kinase
MDKDKVAEAISAARANLEQALAHLEEMPALDPSSVIFAAHALNNFLTVTGGTVDMLLQSLLDHPDPKVRRWLEGLRHATNLMSYVVSQLMSASVTSEVKLKFEEVNWPHFVRRACELYQHVADRKQIRILYSSDAEVPLVWTDRVAIAAVLDNLLSNAVKYSYPGKTVWVEVHGEAESAVCCVRDEGPGLSQEDQAKLYRRGVRLSSLPTAGEPSMGYGLAVAMEMVKKLGCELWCESQLGRGATFCVRLPVPTARRALRA